MRFYLFILSYFISIQLLGQSPHAFDLGELYNFNIKSIYDLHQDQNHNVWIGTDQGLYRFDGTEFRRFKVERYQSEFSFIKEDQTGRIWFLNFTGQLFYFEHNQINLFVDFNDYSTDGLITYDLSLFPEILLTSDKEIYSINFQQAKKETSNPTIKSRISLPDSLAENFMYNILIQDSILYFSVSSHLLKKEKETISYLSSFKENLKKRIFQYKANDEIYALGLTDDNDLIVKFLHSQENEERIVKGLPELIPQSVFYDDEKDCFWIGSYAGLYCFNKDFELVYKKAFLSDYAISSVLKDSEGNYILGTLQNGILVIPSLDILVFNDQNSGLDASYIIDLVQIKEDLLLLLDNKNTIYYFNLVDEKITKKITLNQRITNLHFNKQQAIVYLFPAKKWLNLKEDKVENSLVLNVKNAGEINDSLYLISKIEEAEITAHSFQKESIDLFQSQNYQIRSASEENFASLVLRQKRSIANIARSINEFYVSYSDGLYYYENGIPAPVLYNNDNLIINHFIKDESNIWALSTDGRLFSLEDNQATFEKVFDMGILNITTHKNHILIASDKGLVKYNALNKSLDYIDVIDGMPTNKITNIITTNDHIYASTTHGLVKVPVDYSFKNPLSPQVKVKNIWVNDGMSDTLKIKNLNSDENSIQFELNSYFIRSQNTHKFKHRFSNIDTTWNYVTSNLITFNSLSPGNYFLEIIGINEDNIASEIATVINIKIRKPFYQQAWFYLVASIFSIITISFIYYIRFRNFQIRSNLKESLAESKQKLAESSLASIRAQMNPHFLFNAINSVQMLISEEDYEQSQKYLNKLATLVRSSLTNSEKNFISAGVEIELIKSYLELEKLRFEEDFKYEVQEEERLTGIQIPSMIIQPFVENAVKHGLMHQYGEKHLKIIFRKKDYLECIIEDNGIGREASKKLNEQRGLQHNSFSTHSIGKRFSILREYYHLDLGFHYEDITEGKKVSGTRVILKIPFIKDRKSDDFNS